jgi:uncharacterized MnhB-related membrane protein
MNYLLDPKVFNYLIMVLYLLNSIRWGVHGDLGQVIYWLSAFSLTYSITFLMMKS